MLKFALIGYPLGHSVSKEIHEAGFKSLGVDASYELLEVVEENFIEAVKYLKSNTYSGFNVTIPYKVKIAMFTDEFDKNADMAGAVNTIKLNYGGGFSGYNTDIEGFLRAIPDSSLLYDANATIIGTGGAARAVTIGCIKAGVKKIDFYTRNIPNALEFVNYFRNLSPNTEFVLNQIETLSDLSDTDMLVNATPVGMKGHSADSMPISSDVLATMKKDSLVYDLVYNPTETLLLKTAQKLGLNVISGLDMLVYQAVEAQIIWFGKVPEFSSMKSAAEKSLNRYEIDFM
ncbi:shikimate dehydrogenase [bacterium]|nr:shikimate dehydrogenase [bacterium]